MKKKSKIPQYILFATIFIVSCITTILLKKHGLFDNFTYTTSIEKYVMIIGTILMTFIVLGVHELGHLITGIVLGFRFELFVVGPLGVKRVQDTIIFYVNKNIGYYGGVAATSPKNNHPDNAKKFAKILLAGPITSILFAIPLFCIAYYIDNPLASLLYTSGAMSIGIFFATTIPSTTGIFFTDRKRYQRLTTPGKDQQVELALLRILGNYSKDNSYENINPDDIDILVNDDIPLIQFMGLSNLICFQLEKYKQADKQTIHEYNNISKKMSKSMVKVFDKIIQDYEEKIKVC